VAFNDRLLDYVDPEAVADRLDRIAAGLRTTELGLDSPREEWSAAVANWLGTAP